MNKTASPDVTEPRTPKPVKTLTFASGVELNKSENARRPRGKRRDSAQDSEVLKTEELLRKVTSILDELTPEDVDQLAEQVLELPIDTEERLSAVVALVFENAIDDDPSFSEMYGQMCHRLAKLKVQMSRKPDSSVTFRSMLLRRCQKEFEAGRNLDKVLAKMQAELDAATSDAEREHLDDVLEDAKMNGRRQSLGCTRLIGELFKRKMLKADIVHSCLVELLKKADEDSLHCMCSLLTSVGKELDVGDVKVLLNEIFIEIRKLLAERRFSTRIRFMLKDVVTLRSKSWVSRKAKKEPKTIRQIHQEAAMEEWQEQDEVNQQLIFRNSRSSEVILVAPPLYEPLWAIVPLAESSRTMISSRSLHITKQPKLKDGFQMRPKSVCAWTQGCGERCTRTPALPDLPALPEDITRKKIRVNIEDDFEVTESNMWHQKWISFAKTKTTEPIAMKKKKKKKEEEVKKSRFDIFAVVTKKLEEIKSKPTPMQPQDHGKQVKFGTRYTPTSKAVAEDDVQDSNVKKQHLDVEMAPTPQPQRTSTEVCTRRGNTSNAVKAEPVAPAPQRAAMSDERVKRKSRAIVNEFLHLNNYKEAMERVQELPLGPQLKILVRIGVESTLERSLSSRDHMGQLLLQLVQRGILAKAQFYQGLTDVLEQADDLAIDIPHFWLNLAQLLSPVLKEGGFSMKELFSRLSKPLIPVGSAGIFISQILHVLCKELSQEAVASLWRESGLSWTDVLPEGEDVQTFISQQKLQFVQPDSSAPRDAPSPSMVVPEELPAQLERLLQEDEASNQHILDWIEANVDEPQRSSPTFLRALMTAVCKATVKGDKPRCPVDMFIFKKRMPLLQKYLKSDAGRQLQALYALQAMSDTLGHPPHLLQMFFDILYKWKLVSSEAFNTWQSSKDPTEQQGKAGALKSVKPFFTFLLGFRRGRGD